MSQVTVSTGSGVGLLSIVAAIVSWSINKSILWAIVHGMCGGFYLLYVLLGYGR